MDIAMITYDCNDPRSLAGFYAKLLDAPIEHASHDFIIVGSIPNLGFQRVERHIQSKNRVHVDLHVDDRESAIAKAIELGAHKGDTHSMDDLTWTTMYDPDGNSFDIAG